MQQSNSLDFKLVQRVCLLQQALDQALHSLDELKAQVKDKQWVETQLASTEKYANVQQQAIAHFKQQLAQFTEVQNHLLSVMGDRLNELIDHQQQAFQHLHLHFYESSTELQTYLQYLGQQHQISPISDPDSGEHRLELESEVMIARSMAVHMSKHLALAKQHLGHLRGELDNHHLNLGQILKTIQAMIADLESFDRSETATRSEFSTSASSQADANPQASPQPVSDEATDVSSLQAAVYRQCRQIHELEMVLMQQVEHNTQIRQRYQAIAAERDYYKHELAKLRQPTDSPPATSEEPEPPAASEAEADSLPQGPYVPRRYRGRSQPSQPIQPLKLPEEWQ